MRLKSLKNKTVCFLLVIAISLQSCTVYKKTPVTLDEAVISDRKVLVVKPDNTKLKLKKIEQHDGVYYGAITVKGQIVNVPLNENEIKTIRVLDKSGTTWLNVGIVIGSLGIVGLIIAAISLQDLGNFGFAP